MELMILLFAADIKAILKEYFFNYQMHNSDLHIDMKNKDVSFISSSIEPWSIKLVDTGLNTATGGRLKKTKNLT